MDIIYVVEAYHVNEYRLFLKFNTGESGEVDLKDVVYKYKAAKPLRDPVKFSNFYLDNWPTIAWECGFDIAPESLYSRMKNTIVEKAAVL